MRSEKSIPVFTVLMIALPVLSLTLVAPIGMDNSVWQSMAIDLLRYGKLPYIGSWDVNFPGVLLIHCTGIMLFGTSDFAFRAFDVLLNLCFVFLLYRFERRWLNPRAALIGVMLYVTWYLAGGSPLYAQRDVFIGMFLVIAFDQLFDLGDGRSEWRRLVIASLCLGISVIIRPTSLLFAAVASFAIEGSGLTRWWKRVLFVASTCIPLVISLIPYCYIQGGLQTYYISTIRFIIDLYSKFRSPWTAIFTVSIDSYPIYFFCICGLIYLYRNRARTLEGLSRVPERREIWITGCALLAWFFILVIQRKFLRYQFAPGTILLIPLAAYGADRIISRLPDPRRRAACMLLGVLLLMYGIRWSPLLSFASKFPDVQAALTASHCDVLRDKRTGKSVELQTIAHLNLPKYRNATIEVISYDAHLRADLGRDYLSRYTTMSALTLRTNPDRDDDSSHPEYQRQWRRAYVDSLKMKRPEVIVIGSEVGYWYLGDLWDDSFHNLAGFDELMQTNYRFDTSFGGYQIYELREGVVTVGMAKK